MGFDSLNIECLLSLTIDNVQIFFIKSVGVLPENNSVGKILTKTEMIFLENITNAQTRIIKTLAKLFLRLKLSEFLQGQDPQTIKIISNSFGKPELLNDHAKIKFNLSHSGNILAFAFSKNAEVGIDVEIISRNIPNLNSLKLVFSKKELEHLLYLRKERQADFILKLWTAKEAVAKACGLGMNLDFTKIEPLSGHGLLGTKIKFLSFKNNFHAALAVRF